MSRKSAVVVLTLTALVGVGLCASWLFGWFRANPSQPREFRLQNIGLDKHYGLQMTPSLRKGFGPEVRGPDEDYSNILPGDYVGPDTCRKCHEEQYQRWSVHPHRFMNQLPSKAAIKGDFSDHVWTIRPGATVTFSTDGTAYWITVDQTAQKRTRYKVTRTVGSRFVQCYIGVQTEGPEPPGDQRYTTEHKLPFGYWLRMKRWIPVDYIDAGDDYPEAYSEGMPVPGYGRGIFTKTAKDPETLLNGHPVVPGVDVQASFVSYTTCVHCHNTYPHAYRLFRPSLSGFPDAVFEPDPKPLAATLADKLPAAATAEAFAYLPSKMNPNKDLVTAGISCESCHLGGQEHATHKKNISFFPTNPHVRVTSRSAEKPFTGKRGNPATSQGICAQCHSGSSVATYPNLARIRNSAESFDLLEGACSTQIRCVSCHDPHTAGVPSGGPTLTKHLDTCVSCHPKYSNQEQATAHSRHAASSGVNCMDCHMPRISQGVDEVSRTHRISQPVEQSMISQAAPNACNLCHLDKSVRWSLDELKKGWGRDIQPLAKTPAECLDQPAGKVWLRSSEPIIRMVAIDAYSRSPLWKANLPDLLRGLNDEQPTNRAYAMFAMERILGRPLAVREIDICAGPSQRSKQIEILQAILERKR